MMNLGQLRRAYHEAICRQVLGYRAGVPNIADKSSKKSVRVVDGKRLRDISDLPFDLAI